MVPVDKYTSRYRSAVQRTLTRRRAALAALALLPGVACSPYDDAEVFRTATTVPDDGVAGPTPTDVPVTESTEPQEAAAPEPAVETMSTPVTDSTLVTDSTAVPVTAAPAAPAATLAGAAFTSGAELAVSFTFTPTDGGRRIENPYIAVWVEGESGDLVRTISLWYEQSREGPKWLSHLTRWTSVTNEAVDATTSGATRSPGEYTVVWDGVADDGSVVSDGEYVLFVESSRRGGAYDLTSATITVSGAEFSVQLPDSGELTAVSAELLA